MNYGYKLTETDGGPMFVLGTQSECGAFLPQVGWMQPVGHWTLETKQGGTLRLERATNKPGLAIRIVMRLAGWRWTEYSKRVLPGPL